MEQNYNVNDWAEPCPKYDCRKAACKCGLKYVNIPTSLGDDSEGSAVAPKNGAYCNALVFYEANEHIYIYTQEGVPTLIDVDASDISTLEQEVIKAQKDVHELREDIDDFIYGFDTVAQMKAATNLISGDIVRTLGYRNKNDRGGAFYKITSTGTPNGRNVIAIENMLCAELIDPINLTPEMFGAYGDGIHDDTAIIQACMDYASGKPMKLLLPHLYLIKPTFDAPGNANRKICFRLVTDISVIGLGKNTGFIVDDANANSNKYWAVFFSNTSSSQANVYFKNFKIYQNDNNVSSIELDVYNPRYVICFYSEIHNMVIDDILFDHVYGRDTIMINNNASSNVSINNCVFNFHNIMNRVADYDCTIVYFKVHDYVCMNNYMNGDNYACVSGLELHGYNGTAKENKIFNFRNAMHIQPSGTEPANIEVENNVMRGYDGINLWDNVDTSSYGEKEIRICNNYIQVESSINADEYIGGIRAALTTFTHPIEDILIDGNTIEFINVDENLSISPAQCGGISLNAKTDMRNIIITNNTILSSVASGVLLGSTSATSTNTTEDVIISNNIIKNSGLLQASNPNYGATIYIANKYVQNIVIKDNTFINDIVGSGSKYVLVRTATINSGYECYFANNIVKTVNEGNLEFNDGTTGGFVKQSMSVLPLMSPNGTKYYIKVADDGSLSTSTNWGW